MDDFVVKPVRKKAMIEAILRMLVKSATAAETHSAADAPPLAPVEASALDATLPVDRTAIDDLVREIGQDDTLAMLALFLDETETRLKLLRTLSCDADRPKIEREAHSLKGTSATFGMTDVAQLARTLEREAAKITTEDYGRLLDRIEAAFSVARKLLPESRSSAA